MKKIVDMDEFGGLFDKLTKTSNGTEDFYGGMGWAAVIIKQWLYSQPDAEEKRGRWKFAIGYDINKKVQCQNCLKMAYEPTSYCPNCGAKIYLGETQE